jgi:hypothetical protein
MIEMIALTISCDKNLVKKENYRCVRDPSGRKMAQQVENIYRGNL